MSYKLIRDNESFLKKMKKVRTMHNNLLYNSSII